MSQEHLSLMFKIQVNLLWIRRILALSRVSSVDDSVSTVDHSGDNESSVAPTPPRRSTRT